MSNSFTNYETLNLLVPAFGNTRCLFQRFPLSPLNTLDFNGVTLDDVPFLPQAVTVDASLVPASENVTFEVLQLGFKRIIPGGKSRTFNFPAIKNLRIKIVPSDAISSVNAYFYNYPAFVDGEGSESVVVESGTVSVSSIPGPTGEVRLQISKIFTGATTSGTLITVATTEQLKINSIVVTCAASVDIATVLELYQTGNTAASASLIMGPITTVAGYYSIEFTPAVPLLLPLGDDLLFAFSAAATITGNVCITVDYELI